MYWKVADHVVVFASTLELQYFSQLSGLPMFAYNIKVLQTLVFLDYTQC